MMFMCVCACVNPIDNHFALMKVCTVYVLLPVEVDVGVHWVSLNLAVELLYLVLQSLHFSSTINLG